MRLVGEKVILRYPKVEDAEWLFKNVNKKEIYYNINPHFKVKSLQDEIKWIKEVNKSNKKKEALVLAVVNKETKELMGLCSFNKLNLDNKYGVVGWWIAKEYWGKGYALDATRQLLKYGFETLKLNRIEGNVFEYNKRSLAFIKKLGFKLEGTKRKSLKVGNKYYDEYTVGLLKKEFKL